MDVTTSSLVLDIFTRSKTKDKKQTKDVILMGLICSNCHIMKITKIIDFLTKTRTKVDLVPNPDYEIRKIRIRT